MKDVVYVDFDSTLTVYNTGDLKKYGEDYTGPPVPAMVEKVQNLLLAGYEVKVFTARDLTNRGTLANISEWTLNNIGRRLDITNTKSHEAIAYLDDRAIAVEKNTGKILGYDKQLDKVIKAMQ